MARALAALVAVAVWIAAPPPASAQTALEDSVAERERPDYEPNGIVFGPLASFLIFPGLDATVVATDNLFRSPDNEVSDQIFLLNPKITMRSDWDSHAFNLSAEATNATHVDNSSEDWLDYKVGADGRLDILDSGRVKGEIGFRQGHEARGSPDTTPQAEPTVLQVLSGEVSGDYAVDVILLQLEFEVEDFDFDDSTGCGATPSLCTNGDRNRLQYLIRERTSYELVPGSAAFVEASYNVRDYDQTVDDNGLARSSDGYEVLLGGTLDISGVTFIEASAGYREQEFDDAALPTVSGFSFRGRVIWNPSDLLTTALFVRRLVKETTVDNASAAFASMAGLEADYEVFDNVILSGKTTYQLDDFEGIDRQDTLLSLELGGRYLINGNFFAGAGYQFDQRAADGADASGNDEFTVNQFRVFIGARF
jgi:hypothetical protein